MNNVVQITHFDLLSDGKSTLEVHNGHCRYPLIQALPAKCSNGRFYDLIMIGEDLIQQFCIQMGWITLQLVTLVSPCLHFVVELANFAVGL